MRARRQWCINTKRKQKHTIFAYKIPVHYATAVGKVLRCLQPSLKICCWFMALAARNDPTAGQLLLQAVGKRCARMLTAIVAAVVATSRLRRAAALLVPLPLLLLAAASHRQLLPLLDINKVMLVNQLCWYKYCNNKWQKRQKLYLTLSCKSFTRFLVFLFSCLFPPFCFYT